jgi:hypothetical protein
MGVKHYLLAIGMRLVGGNEASTQSKYIGFVHDGGLMHCIRAMYCVRPGVAVNGSLSLEGGRRVQEALLSNSLDVMSLHA